MRRRRLVALGSAVASVVAVLWAVAVAVPSAAADDAVGLFPADATPAVASWVDTTAYDLGVTFTSDVDGVITGVRFYKGEQNTGTHTGSLWAADGTLMATATFVGETDTGWQTAAFAPTVAITAGTTYVVSYHTSTGFYSVDLDALAAGLDRGLLHVPHDGGAFHVGAGFPERTSAHNYWVDVLFVPAAPPTTAPPTATTVPATTATAPTTAPVTVTSTPSASAGGGLAVTGVQTGLIAGLGVLLLAVGAVTVLAARRRREHDGPTTAGHTTRS